MKGMLRSDTGFGGLHRDELGGVGAGWDSGAPTIAVPVGERCAAAAQACARPVTGERRTSGS